MPFFSIIMPTYNRSAVIYKAIESVLRQSFKDYELIIIDDGSTDGTANELERYLANESIQYYYQQNKGVCPARNNGVGYAKGKYLVFLDSDDEVQNDWLLNYYNIIKTGDADLVFCNMKIIKTDGSEEICNARIPYKREERGFGIYIPGSFCLKKVLFEKIGGYDPLLKFGENTELSIRLGKENPSYAFTDCMSLIYYQSADGGSKNILNQIDSNIYILQKHADYFKQHARLKWIYLQHTGVSSIKLGNYAKGRCYLWKALKVRPYRPDTLLRLVFSLTPFFAKMVWR